MNRLTKLDNDITKAKGTYMPYDERTIITLSDGLYVQCLLNKLGNLEDLTDEIGCPLDVYVNSFDEIICLLENYSKGNNIRLVICNKDYVSVFISRREPLSFGNQVD